jgi:hypothetical protein
MRGTTTCVMLLLSTALLSGTGVANAAEKPKPGGKDATAGQALYWTFDAEHVGKVPAGIQVFSGAWAVRAESDAPSPPNALCQTGSADYPALSLGEKAYGDVAVSVHFKPISGTSDRAAGIIFRIRDQDNYYILRANALEDNVNFYKYERGRRSLIQEGSAKVPSEQWQELQVEVKGNRMRGFLNGKLVVEASDDTFKAGRAGLWTKADSATCFDDVRITPR